MNLRTNKSFIKTITLYCYIVILYHNTFKTLSPNFNLLNLIQNFSAISNVSNTTIPHKQLLIYLNREFLILVGLMSVFSIISNNERSLNPSGKFLTTIQNHL